MRAERLRLKSWRGWFALLATLLSVLGYGYWHVSTHSWLIASMTEDSADGYTRPVTDGTLALLDADGTRLAEVEFDANGATHIHHGKISDCSALESRAFDLDPSAWQACIRRQSAWIMTWAGRVRYADLRIGGCNVRRLPVVLKKYIEDWWLWWVPLPHVGGRPYTTFSLMLRLDRATCNAVAL